MGLAEHNAIIERLVGDTGEPSRVIDAARALAERALPVALAALNARFASPVEMELRDVAIARLAEALPEEGSFDAVTVASAPSSPDALVLRADASAAEIAVAALFGADPEIEAAPIDRDLSPTELEVVSMVFTEIALALNGSGARSFDLRLPPPAAVGAGGARKRALRDGPAVRLDYALVTASAAGSIVVMMPQRVLLRHRSDATASAAGDASATASWGARFGEEVMRSSVRLEATIPIDPMTLGELAALEVGAVIAFPENAQGRTRLSARAKTLFICEFGKLGQSYTVRIRQPFDAGQEFMDGLLPR